MGKHKKPAATSPNQSPSAKMSDDTGDQSKQIDLITSRLIELCGQKPGQNATANILWTEHLEIREKVNELRQLQKSTSTALFNDQESSNRFDRLASMTEWCTKNGLRSEGVTVQEFDEGDSKNFGLKTEKKLDPGEMAVSVPRRLFLSLENGLQKNEAVRSIFATDPLLSGMPNVALSFLVIIEKMKASESFWRLYLDSLPSNYETPLIFLIDGNRELAEAMRGSIAFEETLKLYKNIVRQYAYFYQMISSGAPVFSNLINSKLLTANKFIFDLYLWATVTVMTRINFVPSQQNANEMVPALIPFFDMANHGNVPPCTDFVDDLEAGTRQSAVIYASKAYEPGTQLHIFYGERKYWEFFVYNGFVVDDGRRYPHVLVKLGLSNSDRLLALKDKALQKLALLPSEQFVVCKYPREDGAWKAPFPIGMHRFALIFCSNEKELESFCEDSGEPGQFGWCGKTVEDGKRFLSTRLGLLLRSYSRVDGASGQLGIDGQRMALISKFMRGEMESLESALTFLAQE